MRSTRPLEINPALYNKFLWYLHERETIRAKKVRGEKKPWTKDPILQRYKFTNVIREHDATTLWMRRNWTGPNTDKPLDLQLYNCGFFRYFGTTEFADRVGWQTSYEPELIIRTARDMLLRGEKVFTGAYVITNQGIARPKEEVVMNIFMKQLFGASAALVEIAQETKSWQKVCEHMMVLQGFGGSGFMAKETLADAMQTPVLKDCTDRYTWSPVGPGAKRGINRLLNRPIATNLTADEGLHVMRELFRRFTQDFQPWMPRPGGLFDLHAVQFGLCELDKYIRVENGEGRPRSTYPGV